ncbi:MAG: 6-bladed beta-propeller [Nitrospirae bacterium]|nr:MAG: 6-bladed beta-propeller [Nitrospirota bacterium]
MKTKGMTFFIILATFFSLGMGPRIDEGKKSEPLFWPPPPHEAKIEFLYTVSKPDDMQIKKGFFQKLKEFIIGEENETLIRPFGIAVDDTGKLYVTDRANSSVNIFDPKEGKFSAIEGVGSKRFESPLGVAVDADGNLYISDSVLRRVYVFNGKGALIGEIGSEKVLQRPAGIAIDKKARLLYVIDVLESKIHVYGLDGRYQKAIGAFGDGDAQFNRPTSMTIGNDGNLYIVDAMNSRIQVLDKNGKFISQFGKRGDVSGSFANPRGIALDSDGNIYVTDTLFEVVQIFDRTGRLLLVLGQRGTSAGEFSIPAGVAVSNDDIIYVADSYNQRIQVFKYLKAGSKKNK